MNYFEDSYAVGKPHASLHSYGDITRGHYVHDHGIVTIYAETNHSVMMLALEGRVHFRTFQHKELPSERSLAIRAGKFAKDKYSSESDELCPQCNKSGKVSEDGQFWICSRCQITWD